MSMCGCWTWATGIRRRPQARERDSRPGASAGGTVPTDRTARGAGAALWLAGPGSRSTLDLFGHGFALLTGPAGACGTWRPLSLPKAACPSPGAAAGGGPYAAGPQCPAVGHDGSRPRVRLGVRGERAGGGVGSTRRPRRQPLATTAGRTWMSPRRPGSWPARCGQPRGIRRSTSTPSTMSRRPQRLAQSECRVRCRRCQQGQDPRRRSRPACYVYNVNLIKLPSWRFRLGPHISTRRQGDDEG